MRLHALLIILLTRLAATAEDTGEVGFSRIIHGWTNYSTGFTCTHVTDPDAGDIVHGGWQYLTAIGGNTVYSGQLATELIVELLPQLRIERNATGVEVAWPSTPSGFALESTCSFGEGALWLPMPAVPSLTNRWNRLSAPATQGSQFFRVRKTL